MILFRKIHKWLGLVIGAQVIIWLLSGTVISFIDMQDVSGTTTTKEPAEAPSLSSFESFSPVSQLSLSNNSVQSITLSSFFGEPAYRVVQGGTTTLYDANNGTKLSVDQQLAERIALDSYRGTGAMVESEWLESGSNEVRTFRGSLWQVNFDDQLATRVFVSSDDGQVLAHRNSRWKIVDFLLMLHFMDYPREDSFNNAQSIVIGFGTLWLAISGLFLVYQSFSRSDFLWLPGMKSRGPRVSGTVKSAGQPAQQLALDSSLSYYASLAQCNINLPSNCDGSGSCGLCKIHYEENAPAQTAVDRELIGSAALSEGHRLGCQHRPRSEDVVVVPGIAFQSSLQSAEVLSSRWLTPLLKEIHMRPDEFLQFTSGDYLQFQIPASDVTLAGLAVPESFSDIWDKLGLPDSWSYTHTGYQTRTYSVSTAPDQGLPQELVFTVRFSPPPADTNLLPGVGSSYMCSLQPGDRVLFRGPAGDFRLVDSDREKIFIGGGAGMAPLKSMVLHLLGNEGWQGKVRYWYGARNQQEILYREIFETLARDYTNFEWGVALSEAGNDSQWEGESGLIHQAVHERVLKDHQTLRECEFYLCGPPPMLAATRKMLQELGVGDQMVRFDDFGN